MKKLSMLGCAAVALVLLAAAAALGSSSLTVRGATDTAGKTVVVNPAGRTLYALSPETTHHLLCHSSACTSIWPPLTVPSRTTKLKAGGGVQGKLGLLRRSNGAMQVTLRGKPLYRFSGDSGAHQDNGEGLHSFGGTWHAVTASSVPAASSPSTSEGSTSPMESTPPYTY